jgi:hypothetical protein
MNPKKLGGGLTKSTGIPPTRPVAPKSILHAPPKGQKEKFEKAGSGGPIKTKGGQDKLTLCTAEEGIQG